jgi:integrase
MKEVPNSIPRTGERPFPYESSFITHKFKDYVRASGIKNQSLKLHSLRHSFASHLIMEGVDVLTVSKLLGHSPISVTEMYAYLVPDHLIASIERLKFQVSAHPRHTRKSSQQPIVNNNKGLSLQSGHLGVSKRVLI